SSTRDPSGSRCYRPRRADGDLARKETLNAANRNGRRRFSRERRRLAARREHKLQSWLGACGREQIGVFPPVHPPLKIEKNRACGVCGGPRCEWISRKRLKTIGQGAPCVPGLTEKETPIVAKARFERTRNQLTTKRRAIDDIADSQQLRRVGRARDHRAQWQTRNRGAVDA